ncbi:hypothetical protein BDN70DRAFT_894684 [Pholiota conissans]|uniref:Uncharacterized protein n=1 Tax=Pholiota conissans TaxID=109636 RepID=A0A9P5Z2Q7_9AGAR|nr:hypothetical protein BDN70DRAFT_894684 [Pholiota conissans]
MPRKKGHKKSASTNAITSPSTSKVQPSVESVPLTKYPKTLPLPAFLGNQSSSKGAENTGGRPPSDRDLGERMLDGVHGCAELEIPPGQNVPSPIRVFRYITQKSIAPTNVIACPPDAKRSTFTFFPIHVSVLEANCARLPRPFPAPPIGHLLMQESEEMLLTTATYRLPSIDAFPALQKWLYLKDDLLLLEMVLPSNRTLWEETVEGAERQLAFLYGLYQNACYLEIIDYEFYRVLSIGWNEVYETRELLVKADVKEALDLFNSLRL